MKKSVEIITHVSLWILFVFFVIMLCKIYLQARPNAPFAQYLSYVVLMELTMGLIFFYTTFFTIQWARKKKKNMVILATILLSLVIVFAFPATNHGFWKMMSSIVPHLMLIFLALLFRRFSDSVNQEKRKQIYTVSNTKSSPVLK
jgi:hypothetical protein